MGSPPHMRGKGSSVKAWQARSGITPAHAGKSYGTGKERMIVRDHPRTCGEKRVSPNRPSTGSGSPPHMRGKVSNRSKHALFCGITPAHAGKRLCVSKGDKFLGDHPRTCGEKLLRRLRRAILQGSPPHMRGKGFHSCGISGKDGITPAHAGKRLRAFSGSYPNLDHPRTCGEKHRSAQGVCLDGGSPPHMRGKVKEDNVFE